MGKRRSEVTVAGAFGAGALAMYFADPDRGRRRAVLQGCEPKVSSADVDQVNSRDKAAAAVTWPAAHAVVLTRHCL